MNRKARTSIQTRPSFLVLVEQGETQYKTPKNYHHTMKTTGKEWLSGEPSQPLDGQGSTRWYHRALIITVMINHPVANATGQGEGEAEEAMDRTSTTKNGY